jgi:uncharacterized membrane protein
MINSRSTRELCLPNELFDQSSCAWAYLIFSIFFIKLLIFIIDPLVMFFNGDSQSYLNTALYNWIPMDRSFSYGFIIKLASYLSHSLTSLVVLQIFMVGI